MVSFSDYPILSFALLKSLRLLAAVGLGEAANSLRSDMRPPFSSPSLARYTASLQFRRAKDRISLLSLY